ncbi:tetratricopeptide repeat protein [Streptomyces sp. NPDC059092]|uniref:tetratricopeptide repeat protein n=1 Tax=Streptomyces sp. NPDC059092 TaxID=3346725 RepID=UPI0036CC9846
MSRPPGAAASASSSASGDRAAAAGTNHGVISTGDGATIDQRTVHLPAAALRPPADVEAPGALTNLPAPPSPVFVDRQSDMGELHAALNDGLPATPSVVYGLGGVGKSALALHFAHHHRDRYNPVWWIPAETPSSIAGALAGLAAGINPFGCLASASSAENAAWAVNWLQAHEGWLLIFDNAASPRDLEAVIGPLGSGRHLITSRRSTGWRRLARPLVLETLPADAAVDMLVRLIDDQDADDGHDADTGGSDGPGGADGPLLERIAAELGHLPLALEQAAAYIEYTAITPTTYLERLRRHPARMFAASAPASPGAAGAAGAEVHHHRTVARIWQLSLQAITAESPLAGDILRTFAWFSSAPVPRELAHALHTDPFVVDDALALLHTYSMITLTRRTFSLHGLVRAVARTPDSADPNRAADLITVARERSEGVMWQSLPGDPVFDVTGWERWRELLPHIHALLALLNPEQDTRATADISFLASGFLQGEGHMAQAISYSRRAVDAFVRIYGPDAPRTMAARSFLASAHRTAGDLESALPLHLGNVADCERVLGPDHPDTLVARGNLAYLYALRGETDRALELNRRNLGDYERTVGPDHPHTLNARANLASSYRAAGDLARAVALHEQSLAEYELHFGPDHPETLTARSNLARSWEMADDLDRAIALHERVLTDRERILGPHHPHVDLARNLLAGARRAHSEPGAD